MIDEKKPRACDKNGAVRIDIRECPLGPMPGFPHRIPRCVVNIRMPVGHIDNMGLLAMAQEQKKRVLSFGKQYNAMAFHFWTERQMVEKDEHGNIKYLHEETTAIVDYAPGGLWENALEAKIGDYSTHSFKVMENRTGGEDEGADQD